MGSCALSSICLAAEKNATIVVNLLAMLRNGLADAVHIKILQGPLFNGPVSSPIMA